ncbi:RNA polymerase sigma factor [Microbacterium sp. ZW T5_45]|uniref:RNA polymerase sigma factor n=1 Tax=Microbacterium sp. ZW T5_45 TaxID=3378080 RepID=UPI00385264AB
MDTMFRSGLARRIALAVPTPEPDLESATAGAPTGAPVSPAHVDSKDVAYRRLFDEHWPRVHRHIECFLDDREDVEELTAEVFVAAWRKLDPRNPMPLTWFLRTANNKLRDSIRRTRSRERVIDALTRGLRPEHATLDPAERLAVRSALTSLSARERQVVVLTYWDGLSAGEVADVLRTSQAAVWTTLTRARNKLRIELEGGDHVDPER